MRLRVRLRRGSIAAAAALLLTSVLMGCGGGGRGQGATTRAKWTVLVYMNAANNLMQFGPPNVNQMEKVGSTSDVNIVLQWKQAMCSDCGAPEWTGTRRYRITKDADTNTISSQLVEDLGQSTDMGDWHTLHSYIAWAQQNYPADHYALVIWNHGAGWRPTRSRSSLIMQYPRSVSIDDATQNEIQTWELPQALDVTPRMDLVAFDASLMQMLEVAYEMRSSTPLVVGSEESPPGAGYVYDTFLSDLAANPSMTPTQLGTQIVNRTLQAYGTSSNLTQSELDSTKLEGLAAALDTFSTALLAHVGDSATAEKDARINSQSYAYPDNNDLWDYADIIKAETTSAGLKAAAANVQNAIAAARIAEQHGTINGKSHGIAIYVPPPDQIVPSYANLALSRRTHWLQWIQSQPQ